MNRAIQNIGVYLASVTATALCVTVLFDAASLTNDFFLKVPVEINAALFAQMVTLLILSWIFAFFFALIPLIVLICMKKRWTQSLRFHLLLGAVTGTFTAFFIYSHAPEGPSNQTVAKMILETQFWNLTVCIVISAVLGSFVFWRGTRPIKVITAVI